MRKYYAFVLAMLIATITLTSATTYPGGGDTKVKTEVPGTPVVGKELTYAQLKFEAEKIKGSKLSLKEKIALKIFKKKLSKANGGQMGGKSQLIALLLCFFVGTLGIHRFYLGYTWQGVVQLLTLGGCGIWTLIDFIRIITGDLQPKNGSYDQTL